MSIWHLKKEVRVNYFFQTPIEDVSQTETQHSSIDGENRIQESPKIERNGSKKAVKRKSKETEDDATLAKAIKVMERPLDDFQIFGDYVASELRSLRSDHLQRKLKRMIQRDILQISELSDQEETRSLLTTPVSIPLVSPVYDTSSSNSQSFHTLQSYNNTYSDQLEPGTKIKK